MGRRALGSVAILVIGFAHACVPSWSAAESPEQIALRHVRAFDLGASLVPQGLRIAQLTTSYWVIAAEIGPERARQSVEEELTKLARSVQDEWDLIVARAYLDHIAPEELESITREGRESPFVWKLAAERSKIEASLNSRGKEFFAAFVSKALGQAFHDSLGKP